MELRLTGTIDIQYRPVKIWFIAIGRTRKEHYDIHETWPVAAAYNDLWKRGPLEIRLDKGSLILLVGGQTAWSQPVSAKGKVTVKNFRGVSAELVVEFGDELPTRSWSGETIPIVEPPKGG